MRERRTAAEWAQRCPDLRHAGRGRWAGPCPLCGGVDRFHVETCADGRAIVGCRGCIDGLPQASRRKRFGELVRAVWPSATGRAHPRPSLTRSAAARFDLPGPEPRVELARALWRAGVTADDSPGRAYLAARLAWPPSGLGPRLPASVRWLAREEALGHVSTAKWHGLPAGAIGALVFAWCDKGGELGGVSLVAVNEAGGRVTFGRVAKVYMLGSRAGATFMARRGELDGLIHVAEGEIDALALSLAPWCGSGAVLAAGGTAGLRRADKLGTGSVVIHADGDRGGGGAAATVQARIQAAGRQCSIRWYGDDPADALSVWLRERSAVREADGDEARADADLGAWRDLFETRGSATWAR